MCKHFHLYSSVTTYSTKVPVCFKFELPGYSCVDSLFTNEESFGIICYVIIRLDHDIIYTSATHAILVYDVTGIFKRIVLLAMFS